MNTTVWNIIIEPLEERYSVQWNEWFKACFEANHIKYLPIEGEQVHRNIQHGSFLDVIDTNRYKTKQQERMINLLSTYDDTERWVFFFHDLWHPALTLLAYIRDGMGWKNIKIVGCLHAGSYDEHDFLNKQGMTPWAKHIEEGWFAHLVDQIYVATGFHKELLIQTRNVDWWKIKRTGFPIYPVDLPYYDECFHKNIKKEKIVVFPHRLDDEKNPQLFDILRRAVRRTSWKFVRSKDVCKTKNEYYELLSRAKIAVSFSAQETWGIAMQEATFLGCIPIVPDRLSYPEMYAREFIYNSFDEAVNLVKFYMDNYDESLDLLKGTQDKLRGRGIAAIYNIIDHINNLYRPSQTEPV
jgi:glycosyltransferase involved in cell wall biosynthesis